MAMKKADVDSEQSDDWLTTYADAITLLMAFFVMLLTFAEFDVPAYQEAAAAIKNNIGEGEKDARADTQTLKIDIEDTVIEMAADQVVEVRLDKKGVVIDLAGGAFFKPGSAELHDLAVPVLEKITQMVGSEKFKFYNVEVEGHTDPEPINTPQFPSNWELSTARASTVVRFMGERQIHSQRLKATGYAEMRPKVPNFDRNGEPIPENQQTNRRVSIRVFPMNIDERSKFNEKVDLKSLLKDVKKNEEQTKPTESVQ